jgi:SET domain-containing protein
MKPHDKVFTRLAPSKISGVGVFAILAIKKGQYVFENDKTKMRFLNQSIMNDQPDEIKKLYKDFCVFKGKKVWCPINFNVLTPGWYLNHSTTPNLAADDGIEFYAIRDIESGEELTVDYRTYSDENEDYFTDDKI